MALDRGVGGAGVTGGAGNSRDLTKPGRQTLSENEYVRRQPPDGHILRRILWFYLFGFVGLMMILTPGRRRPAR
jgi:hypothetical protein